MVPGLGVEEYHAPTAGHQGADRQEEEDPVEQATRTDWVEEAPPEPEHQEPKGRDRDVGDVLLQLDECRQMDFLKAARPDLWEWLNNRHQLQQLEALMETKRSLLRSRTSPGLSLEKSRSLFQAEKYRESHPESETMASPTLSPYSGKKNLLGSRPDDSVLPFVKTPDI